MTSDQLTIETPEQIGLDYTLAGVGSRFLALAVDSLIQGAAMLFLGIAAFGIASVAKNIGRDLSLFVLALLVLGGFAVLYVYFAAFEALWQGQTPGKRLVGLRVIAVSGRPITAFQAILRNVLRIVDQLPFYSIGIGSILATRLNQRLGDLAAGTVVVLERPGRASVVTPAAARAARLGAARLTAQEIRLIEAFLRRREDLDWFVRERTAAEIAGRVQKRLECPPGDSNEEMLQQVVAEYRDTVSYR